ncbi:protein phosphatase 2C domain-containing protein [Glycomyces sp. NRRL B-16210]|uniref:protein phosphatase 2C domain-containing protein n=1 Tax=Glycomyces sp. NRRL B-16210 TaxID=1463821 RepID=UPI0004BFA1C4|nr:protein phosphatase 2C domain-containing protein [Glycomyces sp. NRRL B-16210]
MRVRSWSATGSGKGNEDLAASGDRWAVVLDGAGPPAGMDVGCEHGAAWVVARLGAHLRERLDLGLAPAEALRESIGRTVADHGPACDTAHPRAIGATAAVVRVAGADVEWLVVGDAAVVIERSSGGVAVTTDDRLARLPDPPSDEAGVRTYVARYRNRPGGFWVAGAVPEAADHALTGRLPRTEVRRVLLCTNGVTRLVERYGYAWADLVRIASTGRGPAALVDAVRGAECTDPEVRSGRRHDDATAVLVEFGD